MPFREKFKRALGRDRSGSGASSLKTSKTNDGNAQGDDPEPKPKYRAPVDPKHKERLEAFSFANTWRRKSTSSLYSPHGSRMPSRNNSASEPHKHVTGGRSNAHFGTLVEDADDATDTMNGKYVESDHT